MTLTFTQLIPVFLVFILYFAGLPIVYALFGSTFFYFLVLDPSTQCWLLLQKVMNSTQSFSMLAIPFFIMSGSVMNFGGISDKMMDFCECVTGHMRGGLAQVNVLLSMLMGGCSGSANADCAMQSKMLVPEMEKRGYSKAFSAAITAASSAATPVIPPGVNLIVYCLIAQASLGRTFAAGYVPGILMSLSMMITVAIIAKKRNYPTTREKFPPAKVVAKQALDSFWGLFFPFGIILGMRFGMFTPSEGGAVAVLYCFVIGKLVYKRLSFRKHFVPIVLDTIAGTSSVVLIMVSASVFGQYMTWINLPKIVTTAVLNLTSNKYAFLMLTNVILLIMGMFLEGGAALIDHHPVAAACGKKPRHRRLPLRPCRDCQHHDRRYHSSVRLHDVHHLRHHQVPDKRFPEGGLAVYRLLDTRPAPAHFLPDSDQHCSRSDLRRRSVSLSLENLINKKDLRRDPKVFWCLEANE